LLVIFTFCVPIFILLIISNFMLSIFSSHMVIRWKVWLLQ
jgi:uncharacterized membrane protein SpoIIM required for sporulation